MKIKGNNIHTVICSYDTYIDESTMIAMNEKISAKLLMISLCRVTVDCAHKFTYARSTSHRAEIILR